MKHKARLYTAGELTTPAEGPWNKSNASDCQDKPNVEENIENILEEFKELTMEPDYNKPVKHGHSLEIVVENLIPKMQWIET